MRSVTGTAAIPPVTLGRHDWCNASLFELTQESLAAETEKLMRVPSSSDAKLPEVGEDESGWT